MNTPSPVCRLSTEDNTLKFIPGMPAFESVNSHNKGEEISKILTEAFTGKGKQDLVGKGMPPTNLEDIDFDKLDIDLDQLNETLNNAMQEQFASSMFSFFGNFAVSGDTYYVEYEQKLFRWKPGMTAWHFTGLVDKGENPFSNLLSTPFDYSAPVATSFDVMDSMGFEIAVSGSTVYVGKRDRHLFQSFDEGDTWNDVTADLPFPVEAFNAITFAGETVYVATDQGVAYSSDGIHWHTATDTEGNIPVIDRMAVEGTTVYGQSEQHVYQLKENSNTWKQATSEIPGVVSSLVVDNNTLYVGTLNRGVLRFTLDE